MLRKWFAPPARGRSSRPGIAAEVAVLAAAGLFLGIIGPFGTDSAPTLRRLGYWIVNIVGGGLIGIAIDRLLVDRVRSEWPRVLSVSLLMTPAVTLLVVINAALFFLHRASVHAYVELLWQVFVIAFPVMILRMLAWKPPKRIVETRTLIEAPLPAAEAKFRKRLPARLRHARLIAIQAQDHYVRVHTDQGRELLGLRFADAIEDLSAAHGYQIHRSWWVAGGAIEQVQWRRSSGTACLSGGIVAPVSRSGAAVLRAAGWL